VVSTGPFFVHPAGMAENTSATAQRLLMEGRRDAAVALIESAAAHHDPDALFQQGLWRLTGDVLPRDLPAARMAFRRSGALGHGEARMIDIALTANGSGAPADWAEAMRLLSAAVAADDPHANQLRLLLSAMSVDERGEPIRLPEIDDLVRDGSIRRARAFMTPDECAHVARSAADLLAPSHVMDPRTGRAIPHPIRTSDAAVIGPVREDPVIRAINMRIARISGTAVMQGEALTVLRYSPGQQFKLHSDILPHVRNQRVATVIVYLNEGFAGGETVFPHHNLTIVPKGGDAVIFDNVDATGRPLDSARHAGVAPRSGVKWIATRWIRARPFDVWRGPESVESRMT
jgi:prolyl 4-hydroxylase